MLDSDKVKLVQVAGVNNEAGQGSMFDGVPSSKRRGRAAGKRKKRNKTEDKGTESTKAAELEDQEKSLDLP